MVNISLFSIQSIIIIVITIVIISYQHAGIALGVYLALISSAKAISIGGIPLIWWFATVAILTAVFIYNKQYWLLKQNYFRSKWIVPWMGYWWLLTALVLIFTQPPFYTDLSRNLLMYIILPCPIFILISFQQEQLKYFGLAYIVTTLFNGYLILALGGFHISPFAYQEILSGSSVIQENILNYHRIGTAFGISAILLIAFFFATRNIFYRSGLLIALFYTISIMYLIGSRQVFIASQTSILFLLCYYLVVISKRFSKLTALSFIAAITFLVAWLYTQSDYSFLRGAGGLSYAFYDSISMRQTYWNLGIVQFLENPLFGTIFQTRYGHNIFIATLESQGLVGGLMFSGFLFFFAIQIKQIFSNPQYRQNILIVTLLSIFMFSMIRSQYSGSFLSSYPIYWVSASLWSLNSNRISQSA